MEVFEAFLGCSCRWTGRVEDSKSVWRTPLDVRLAFEGFTGDELPRCSNQAVNLGV